MAESKHKVNYSGKWDYSTACLIHIGVLNPERDKGKASIACHSLNLAHTSLIQISR